MAGVALRTAVWAILCAFAVAAPAVRVRAAEGASRRIETRQPPTAGDREYQLKAAFLYNFIRYTTWPAEAFEEPDDPIVVTTIGHDPFGDQIDELFEGKELHGRRIVVERVREIPLRLDAQVVFASELDRAQRLLLFERLREKPVLIVGERPRFANEGGHCNFYIEEGRVRFEINTDSLAKSGLRMSSQLLKLARIVKQEKQKEKEK